MDEVKRDINIIAKILLGVSMLMLVLTIISSITSISTNSLLGISNRTLIIGIILDVFILVAAILTFCKKKYGLIALIILFIIRVFATIPLSGDIPYTYKLGANMALLLRDFAPFAIAMCFKKNGVSGWGCFFNSEDKKEDNISRDVTSPLKTKKSSNNKKQRRIIFAILVVTVIALSVFAIIISMWKAPEPIDNYPTKAKAFFHISDENKAAYYLECATNSHKNALSLNEKEYIEACKLMRPHKQTTLIGLADLLKENKDYNSSLEYYLQAYKDLKTYDEGAWRELMDAYYLVSSDNKGAESQDALNKAARYAEDLIKNCSVDPMPLRTLMEYHLYNKRYGTAFYWGTLYLNRIGTSNLDLYNSHSGLSILDAYREKLFSSTVDDFYVMLSGEGTHFSKTEPTGSNEEADIYYRVRRCGPNDTAYGDEIFVVICNQNAGRLYTAKEFFGSKNIISWRKNNNSNDNKAFSFALHINGLP